MKAATKKLLLWGGLAVGVAGLGLGGYYLYTHRAGAPAQALTPGHRYQVQVPLLQGETPQNPPDPASLQAHLDQQFGPGKFRLVSVTVSGQTILVTFDDVNVSVTGGAAAVHQYLQLDPTVPLLDMGTAPAQAA